MKKVQKAFLYILIILALLLAGGLYWFYQNNNNQNSTSVYSKNNNDELGQGEDEQYDSDNEPNELLKNYGPMPEFTGIDKWFNSEPITKEQLKDKVVLVNFWNYSSINSIRTLPQITKWYDTYKDQGFVIVGVHTPEFNFEKVPMNVESAIKKYAIAYPVAQDNNYKTWTAYKNQFWPAQYLINKDGNIVYTHFGEGKYERTEKAIRTLIGLEGDFQISEADSPTSAMPEIYFGLTRLKNFGGTEKPSTNNQIYTFPPKLKTGLFALEGNWQFTQESAVHTKGFGRIKLNFDAAKVFIVAQSNRPTTIRVYVDGNLIKGVVVNESDLYQLFDSISSGPHTMEIEIPDDNFQAFTFTFG